MPIILSAVNPTWPNIVHIGHIAICNVSITMCTVKGFHNMSGTNHINLPPYF